GLDCCGSIEWVGVNGGQQGSFAAPEAACEVRIGFNMCDCVARAPAAQDGRTVPPGTNALVDCVSGVCLTRGP
ncbi:MAG: hypothetical protein WCJ30_03245, partial [Deltaproteobacteria bacterium]